MNEKQLKRLENIEEKIKGLAEEMGLTITETIFEVVSSRRMIEALAYNLPTNFSHWKFGRDYEKIKTIYEHRGAGIPYEVVWNFDPPKAFLVETNPLALNIMIIAHVYGHVDFYLENKYMKKAAAINLAREARKAEKRFKKYEREYGLSEYEKIVESAFTLKDHQQPDILAESKDDEILREKLIELKTERIKSLQKREFHQDKSEIEELEKEIKKLKHKTPPRPRYDILSYLLEKSPKPLSSWQEDIVSTVNEQGKFSEYQRRCKMLSEGWAVFVHHHIMHQLFENNDITQEEFKEYSRYHSMVLSQKKKNLNPYYLGLKLYEDLIYRWDRGMHGEEFRRNQDPYKWSNWNTEENKGWDKIFEVRKNYTDRMAVKEFFTEKFIKEANIYIWKEVKDTKTGIKKYIIAEDDPKKIKQTLDNSFSLYSMPIISVEDGNYNGNRELYLKHEFIGFELDPRFETQSLENIFNLWGRPVHLETVKLERDKQDNPTGNKIKILHSYDGGTHDIQEGSG